MTERFVRYRMGSIRDRLPVRVILEFDDGREFEGYLDPHFYQSVVDDEVDEGVLFVRYRSLQLAAEEET